MKIRTGFVSNSSSSSFIIVCKDFNILEPLNGFTEYQDLKKDMREDPEITRDLLKELLRAHLYNVYYATEKEYLDNWTGWDELTCSVKYNGCISEELSRDIVLNKRSFEEFLEFLEDKRLEEEVDALYAYLNQKGYKIATVEYEDGTEYGSHMEHYFMPFVMHFPNDDVTTVRLSHH